MKIVPQEDFLAETMGGWPVQSNMTAYAGKSFDCACGKNHQFSGEQSEVLRELPMMKYVFRCPTRDGLTLVKIKGFFSIKIESLLGARD